jgi:hypothetical protein
MFTLRRLFIAVAYLALLCAALVYRSQVLASVVFTLTIAFGLLATIAAWRQPRNRGYYAAIALVIACYMAIVFYDRLDEIEQNLFTNQLVFRAWAAIETENPYGIPVELGWSYWHETFYMTRQEALPYEMKTRSQVLELRAFFYTIHAAVALLLGLLAGWITVWIERRQTAT